MTRTRLIPPCGVLRKPAAGASPPPEEDMLLWLRKGVGQTTTQWDDQSAGTNHMALTNAPTVNGDGSIGFNGSDERGATADLEDVIAQPYTVYLRAKIVSWVDGALLMSGNNFVDFFQMGGVSPQVQAKGSGGTIIGPVGGMTVGEYASLCVVWDTTNSLVRVNATETTGDLGANGFSDAVTLADFAGGGFAGNIDVMEMIVYGAAHDAATRNAVIAWLDSL